MLALPFVSSCIHCQAALANSGVALEFVSDELKEDEEAAGSELHTRLRSKPQHRIDAGRLVRRFPGPSKTTRT